ncbi:DinB family protein [Muricauda oceani]|jgi:uncharacterized damage-inducible protein DinB|uniref:DinB family protein n=2 Tax=Flagellimonas TaxID=444459 RepID=A0A6G7IYJ9_9FLAO|nr:MULTISPECIES: DinB family protein [Allomuricauda]MBW8244748.1 DinB family protein [Allomuricauda oceani]MDF0708742.1 DinB family protein [[Muricauda] okinawensis]QII43681.1 DinB family protein [Allomuricauda oceani]
MNQIKWFERKFDFSYEQNIFPSIVERLEGTSIRIKSKLETIPFDLLETKNGGKWSIKVNVGHLSDLEPLWKIRLGEILNDEEYLSSADLENQKTEIALHNNKSIDDLIFEFEGLRKTTLEQLSKLTEKDVYRTALHPRLLQPMRIMDLFLFVAEHDDHHLARITEIIRAHDNDISSASL